jgi:hypothetical protein
MIIIEKKVQKSSFKLGSVSNWVVFKENMSVRGKWKSDLTHFRLFWFVLSASISSCGFFCLAHLQNFCLSLLDCEVSFGASFVRKEIFCQHLKHKFVVADHDPPIVSISILMTDPALYYINPLDLQQGLAWTANLLPSKFGGKCSIRQEAVLEPHHMKLKFVTCLY